MNNVTTWPENLTNNGIYNNIADATPDTSLIDPSMFGANNIDLNQLQNNPQFQARLQNGAVRNPYQVSSMVPSKRSREDSTGASLSRSQTPAQQGQYGFQGNQHSGVQPLQVPPPFQHLQQGGSANATPSPTLQNQQHFRPGGAPQRVQTVSPARNPNVPQMPGMNYMQGSPMPPGYNQNFGGSFPVQPVALSQNLQNRQQEAQRQYQIRLQQQQQQLAQSNIAAQQRHQTGPMLGSSAPQQGMPMNRNPAQMQNPQARNTLETFLKNVSALMQQMGQPFNPQPLIGMRPVNLLQLYSGVMKQKGSKRVTAAGGWPITAQMMGFPQQNFPTAAEEMRIIFEQNLGPYEAAYFAKMQSKSMANPQQAQIATLSAAQQMSPTKAIPQMAPNNLQSQQQYLQQLQRAQSMQHQQMESSTPMKNNVSMPTANGWSTPQMDSASKMQQNALNQHRKSLNRQLEATPPQVQPPGFPSPSPGPGEKMRESAPPLGPPTSNGIVKDLGVKLEHGTEYQPKVRTLADTHGGVQVDGLGEVGAGLVKLKPNVPALEEMGVIDIRALSMSLQSGIHGEVRLALDYLVKLSHETRVQLELEKCDDLMDILIDCAEEQLDALAEDAPEVSDILDLTSYEDVIRNCRAEVDSLQDIPEFGTPAYELDRTAERLIAITTVLRNLSFFEFNHSLLSTATVIKFLSNAIRLVGTRIMLLRSHTNTADFMKDLITFLSNTTDKIELPSREEAYNILHFLLSFVPCPRPSNPVRFTPYNPAIHRYLPPAVDSLAKLLARDDPNRHFYKHLFTMDAASTPPYDLLTRAFALAISVVPDRSKGPINPAKEMRIAEARKPYLMQGMLAADILASLAPGPETGIARSWLEAEDGWAQSLLRLSVFLFSTDASPRPPPPPQGTRQMPRMDHDSQGFQLITHRALAMLKKLGEKCKGGETVVIGSGGTVNLENADGKADADDESDDDAAREVGGSRWRVKADVLPKKEMLLGALLTPNIDQVALRQLCAFAGLDD
jgi:SWI/SNF chromatin-remodeling complex subunit SWI1